ncbi:hypothetical protein GCM10022416_59820 [Actinomadura keratinilytica]|uniref:Guanylate cyclase domain-containing protein n=2 Tax=Actinomadura keratinilytica TaxID=547461 RepID=A0ABP7ZHD0_9ACTN
MGSTSDDVGAQNLPTGTADDDTRMFAPAPGTGARPAREARQLQVVKLWRMLRNHIPSDAPTPLDVLIAEATAGAEVLDADTISRRLQRAADAGREQPPWDEIVNQPSTRRTLAQVLRALSLLEHTALGTTGARRLRDRPDDGLISETLDAAQAFSRSSSPPDHQEALVAVIDIHEFANRPEHGQLALREAMYRLLQQAFEHSLGAGLDGAHVEDRGDGALVVLPQCPQPAAVPKLVDELRTRLRAHNRVRTAETALRLRVALHTGTVRANDYEVSGGAIMFACRLLDAPVARQAIADADAHLVMMLSRSLHARSGASDAAGMDQFRPVHFHVKGIVGQGWLLVDATPPPSASSERPDDADSQATGTDAGRSAASAPTAEDAPAQPVAFPSVRSRRRIEAPDLSEDDFRLLAQIASGATTEDAADNLQMSARTVRRRLRQICDRLEVDTPIEAVVWAARRHLI